MLVPVEKSACNCLFRLHRITACVLLIELASRCALRRPELLRIDQLHSYFTSHL